MTEGLWAALAEAVDEQIIGRSDYAVVVAALADASRHRIVNVFDRAEDGELDDPLTCSWAVDVAVMDGWARVASVHWSQLPVSLEDVRREHAWAVVQQAAS